MHEPHKSMHTFCHRSSVEMAQVFSNLLLHFSIAMNSFLSLLSFLLVLQFEAVFVGSHRGRQAKETRRDIINQVKDAVCLMILSDIQIWTVLIDASTNTI